MMADLITYLNTRLTPLAESLPIPVRLVGLVRTVEKTESKKTRKFPMPADEADTVPVLPNSGLGLLLYWEQQQAARAIDEATTRTKYRAGVRLVAWYDSRKVVLSSGSVKIGLVRHLLHNLLGGYANLPEGVQALKIKQGAVPETRSELFGHYTFDNNASQYMTLPYDAVGIDITAEWWLDHACLPQLDGIATYACA